MSALDFYSSFDDEWDGDERNNLQWSEADWYDYLQRQDEEIERFLAIYDRIDPEADRIDEAARLMGWDEASEDAFNSETILLSISLIDREEQESKENLAPYTLHQHPVFIITRAFYRYLFRSWERLRHSYRDDKLWGVLGWQYAQSLSTWERNTLLGLQALDIGDFTLSICQLKYALRAFNQTLHVLDKLPDIPNPEVLNLIHECRIRLFDLREIWLRVINDCREEIRHQRDERD